MSTLTWASHTPLFDRLCAPVPASAPERLLQGADLKVSLARDLERLLNARNGLTLDEALGCEVSALTYGMPDFFASGLHPGGDLQVLAERVQHAIASFEPRLREVTVQAQSDARYPDRARLVVTAAVAVGRQPQRVDFDIALDEAATVRATEP